MFPDKEWDGCRKSVAMIANSQTATTALWEWQATLQAHLLHFSLTQSPCCCSWAPKTALAQLVSACSQGSACCSVSGCTLDNYQLHCWQGNLSSAFSGATHLPPVALCFFSDTEHREHDSHRRGYSSVTGHTAGRSVVCSHRKSRCMSFKHCLVTFFMKYWENVGYSLILLKTESSM